MIFCPYKENEHLHVHLQAFLYGPVREEKLPSHRYDPYLFAYAKLLFDGLTDLNSHQYCMKVPVFPHCSPDLILTADS